MIAVTTMSKISHIDGYVLLAILFVFSIYLFVTISLCVIDSIKNILRYGRIKKLWKEEGCLIPRLKKYYLLTEKLTGKIAIDKKAGIVYNKTIHRIGVVGDRILLNQKTRERIYDEIHSTFDKWYCLPFKVVGLL